MKKFKWFISGVTALCMMFSMITFATEADIEENPEADAAEALSSEAELPEGKGTVKDAIDFSDVAGTQYQDAVGLLSKLSVIKGDVDGLFHPERDVTRAEAVAMIIRMIGLDESITGSAAETYFSDVSVVDWYVGYVNMAADLKIVNGHGDGTFCPNDPVTHEEYLKMLICALGLDHIAEDRGGYPAGYVSTANIYDITDGTSGVKSDPADRGTIAIYTYNALFSELPNVIYYTPEGVVTSGKRQETILNSVYNVYEITGVITANDVTSLSDALAAESDGYVRVKDENGNEDVYLADKSDAEKYLGYKADVYIKKMSNDVDTVVWVRGLNKNNVVTIDPDNFGGIVQSGSGYTLKYASDDRRGEQQYRVDMFANLIVNGKSKGPGSSMTDEELTAQFPRSGEIKLLDNDGDKNYETLFVTRYENYIVSRVSESERKLILKPNSKHARTSHEIVLDHNESDHKFSIIKDGKEIELTDIQRNDVVTLEESGTEPYLRTIVNVSSSKLTGAASISREASTKNGDKRELTIDGEIYYLAYDYIGAEPKVGADYDFYLNTLNEIVYVDNATIDSNYALFIKSVIPEISFDSCKFQLVTADGEMKSVTASGKVSYNGKSTDAEAVCRELTKPQLVKVKINSSGELTSLETARRPEGSSSVLPEVEIISPNEKEFILNAYDSQNSSAAARSKLYYKSGDLSRITGPRGSFVVPNDCVIFSIEETDAQGNPVAEQVRVTTNMDAFSNEKAYYFEIYDLDEYMKAGAIISYGLHKDEKEGAVSRTSNILIVDKLVTALNEEDDVVLKLCGYQNRKYVELAIADEPKDSADNVNPETFEKQEYDKLVGLKQGAAIQYKANFDNEISEYRVLYSPVTLPYGQENTAGVVEAGEFSWGTSGSNPINKDLVSFVGKVTAIDDEVIIMTSNDGINLKTYAIPDSVNVYKFNRTKDTVEVSSSADIIPNESLIFARIEKDVLKEIIVIED